MDVKGKRIGVYGYGITGQAVASALMAKGSIPVVFDDRNVESLSAKLEKQRDENGLEYHIGSWDATEHFASLSTLVISPGIWQDNPNLDVARRFGLETISEIEFAWRVGKGTVIAVTGSNGKSTTTALAGEIMKRAYAEKKGDVYVVGNIGSPYIGVAFNLKPEDVIVLEVSSFQLEAMPTFNPHIAIFTNITPDHLERHGTFENYAAIKRSLVSLMTEDDCVIYNFEDENLQPSMFPNSAPRYLGFTSAAQSFPELGAWLDNAEILADLGKGVVERYPQAMVKLKGLHNVENSMCALLACRLMGVQSGTIIEAVEGFQGFPHRIEFVRELGGVRWYNDSKATNPESTVTALRAFDEPIILIMGGRDKGTPLDALARLARSKAEKVVLFGEAADRFETEMRNIGFGNIERASNIEDIVKLVRRAATPGRIVLFSPACASFDMFSSFEERGNVFKGIVKNLPEVGV
ncbi:UDP-N-acetylmuramoyl-L-alanine--D-glutamate ligase [bacterium]|nr:UDP-N-acetylmuramoyl-L-alanine--D-glutamate ligase [bacterium]